MGRIVVDSISKDLNIARIEIDGKIIEISKELLPEGVQEGDILNFIKADNSGVKNRIRQLEERLIQNGKKVHT